MSPYSPWFIAAYAICAFAGCWLYLAQKHFNVPSDVALWTSATAITVLRLITWKFDVRMER